MRRRRGCSRDNARVNGDGRAIDRRMTCHMTAGVTIRAQRAPTLGTAVDGRVSVCRRRGLIGRSTVLAIARPTTGLGAVR